MNLSTPVVRWIPIVPINTPTKPEIRFLRDDFPLIDASIDRANTASPKYSAGPNSKASFANNGAAKIKIIKLKIPPKTLDTAASPSARPGSPFLAIGYPSKAVATAGGAPGAFINIAVMDPPKVPAQYKAAIIEIAATGSREIVKGINKAIAIGELRPGNAPTKTPIKTPDNIKIIFSNSNNRPKPFATSSNF